MKKWVALALVVIVALGAVIALRWVRHGVSVERAGEITYLVDHPGMRQRSLTAVAYTAQFVLTPQKCLALRRSDGRISLPILPEGSRIRRAGGVAVIDTPTHTFEINDVVEFGSGEVQAPTGGLPGACRTLSTRLLDDPTPGRFPSS